MDMESNEEVQLDTQSDLAVYFGRVITVDGERFSPISNADYTETTLLYVTPAGIKRGVVVQGEMRNAVKLR